MSKKTKRQSRSTTSAASTPASSPARASSVSQAEAFNPDYSYVKKDLRRIGTLAGIFLTVLVVLSFFLR
jgi:hypothetical protein